MKQFVKSIIPALIIGVMYGVGIPLMVIETAQNDIRHYQMDLFVDFASVHKTLIYDLEANKPIDDINSDILTVYQSVEQVQMLMDKNDSKRNLFEGYLAGLFLTRAEVHDAKDIKWMIGKDFIEKFYTKIAAAFSYKGA